MTAIYREIRAVCFKFLNTERLKIAADTFLDDENAPLPTPNDIAMRERILLNAPRSASKRVFKTLSGLAPSGEELSKLLEVYAGKKYMIVAGHGRKNASVLLHKDATQSDTLRALLVFHRVERGRAEGGAIDDLRRAAEDWADAAVPRFQRALEDAGWHHDKFMFGGVRKRLRW